MCYVRPSLGLFIGRTIICAPLVRTVGSWGLMLGRTMMWTHLRPSRADCGILGISVGSLDDVDAFAPLLCELRDLGR